MGHNCSASAAFEMCKRWAGRGSVLESGDKPTLVLIPCEERFSGDYESCVLVKYETGGWA